MESLGRGAHELARAGRRPHRRSGPRRRVVRSPRGPPASGRAGGVDREGGLVAEQVADHGRQDEPERRVDRRHGDRRHPRRKRVSPSLATTIGVALWARKIATSLATSSAFEPDKTGRAHEDQRLGRQVDVLLVLGRVAGDRLVTELTELDPNLLGRDLVGAVADDRPVTCNGAWRRAASAISGRRASTSRIASGTARRTASSRDRRAGSPSPWPRRWRTTAASPPRPARRTPSWTRHSSPRHGRRTCTARRRPSR